MRLLKYMGILCLAGMAAAAERATAIGTVTDAEGKPVEHAMVLVYEAGVRTGYGIYCPTCWADCGKRALTDAEGRYTIAGLDPELVFKLLVIRDNYGAMLVEHVDPAKGPAAAAVLKPRIPPEDLSQVARGKVVDMHGAAVRDALVEHLGVVLIEPDGGMSHAFGGPMNWIDSIAVTDEKGAFEIACAKPAVELNLRISPRGMAAKLVTLKTGADRKTVTVSDGRSFAAAWWRAASRWRMRRSDSASTAAPLAPFFPS